MSDEKKTINVQSSLSEEVVVEENKPQASKTELQKKYRRLSVVLTCVLIIAALMFIGIYQRCAILGHNWSAPDCLTAKTCSRCGSAEGQPLGHRWQKATCTAPKTCSECGTMEGMASGHKWSKVHTNQFELATVRHILVRFDDNTDQAKHAAKNEIVRILKEFQQGEPSEEAFAGMAKKYSHDISGENGGLYENVCKGIAPVSLSDWCLDKSRVYGDFGIVETELGYHLVYFIQSGQYMIDHNEPQYCTECYETNGNLLNVGDAKDNELVAWKACDVVSLSFNMLIADPVRAFADAEYGNSYKSNFITADEFRAILQQLYDNGCVLVDLNDLYYQEFDTSSGRYVFREKQVLLPAGKKPIMLTQSGGYYTYMIDSDGDGKADASGDGFAARLCWNGSFYNELVNNDGDLCIGFYDLVPILENFIAANPEFSYQGARAIIAFSGYDGVLGYRINSTTLTDSELQSEREGAAAIVQALKNAGYKLACYTYGNVNYNIKDVAAIQADLRKWETEIATWIGAVDVMVFARKADIAGAESYSGNSKFNVLYNAGFRYFIGTSDTPWNQVDDLYVRHNCISVTGYNLCNNADWFAGMFDASAVLDNSRNR